jgi:hypothetical protein
MKNTIYTKLHQAKQNIGKVAKNAKNPHFKNTYADLNALIEAVEPILLESGLIMLQPLVDNKVFTQIIDIESGEKLESFMELPTLNNPQAMGSAITYFRRYTLQSIMSLQAVDDDGQAAAQATPKKAKTTDAVVDQFVAAVQNGTAKWTIEKFIAAYDLTEVQQNKINAL